MRTRPHWMAHIPKKRQGKESIAESGSPARADGLGRAEHIRATVTEKTFPVGRCLRART